MVGQKTPPLHEILTQLFITEISDADYFNTDNYRTPLKMQHKICLKILQLHKCFYSTQCTLADVSNEMGKFLS